MSVRAGRIVRIGLAAGGVGYAAVIVVVSGLNLLAGRSPFYTAALFGASLFYGLSDPAALVVAPGPVLAYNGVHLLAFLALGLGGSGLVAIAERYPSAQYVILVLLVFVAFHVWGGLALFAHPLLGAETWWHVGVGTLVAAIAMGLYYLRRYPLVVREARLMRMGEPSFPPED
jgi:hypothetical protein